MYNTFTWLPPEARGVLHPPASFFAFLFIFTKAMRLADGTNMIDM